MVVGQKRSKNGNKNVKVASRRFWFKKYHLQDSSHTAL
jgi:hypothetical protein